MVLEMVSKDINQSIIFLIAYFLVAYLVLWFFGGACLDPLSGGTCLSKEAISGLSNVPLLQLFLPLNPWHSLMYWFAPIAGIIISYFTLKWYNEYFETKFASSIFILVILIFALVFGYFINLNWYYGEAAALNSRDGVKVGLHFCFSEITPAECSATVGKINQELINQAQSNNLSTVQQNIPVNFWAELKESIYLTFILGAIIGWLPLFVKNFLESRKK
jgi:hypothetical protein